jgi:hypothetical protein
MNAPSKILCGGRSGCEILCRNPFLASCEAVIMEKKLTAA